jgi:hypothetical protein
MPRKKRTIPPKYNPDDVAFVKIQEPPEDDFFHQVGDIVGIQREADYGDGLKRIAVAGCIVESLEMLMPADIGYAQAHLITMLAEKLTRAACNPDKADTWIDIAGYARFGYRARRQ